MTDPLNKYLYTLVALAMEGIPQVGEYFATRLFDGAVAALDGLQADGQLSEDETAYLRTELRRALDGHHPEGYALYEALLRPQTPAQQADPTLWPHPRIASAAAELTGACQAHCGRLADYWLGSTSWRHCGAAACVDQLTRDYRALRVLEGHHD